jgi:hypothetical protein
MRVRPTRTTGLPLRRPPKLDLARRPSSSEFLCALVVLRAFRLRARLPGFRPSSRHHRFASTNTGASQASATFRPQAFSTSRRFAPRNVPPACSIRQPRPGFSLVQGLLPSCSLSSLIGKSCPLVVSRARPTGRNRLPAERAPTPRPFSTRGRVVSRFGFTRPAARSPLRVSVPSGRSVSVLPSGYPIGSARDVPPARSSVARWSRRTVFSVSRRRPWLATSLPGPARSKLSSLPLVRHRSSSPG